MKPEEKAINYLSITRSKAKMFEFNIPESDHLETKVNFVDLLDLTIGIIGDLTSNYSSNSGGTNEFLFSAKYFDALINIGNLKITDESHDYLTLLGAVAYYLSDYPGSSKVLIRNLKYNNIDLNANKLEHIILSIINKSNINPNVFTDNIFKEELIQFSFAYNDFNSNGENLDRLISLTDKLTKTFYKLGSGRDLLFADIINALTKKYAAVSAWTTLPRYSNLSKENWEHYLRRTNAIKEFWPSQVLLGEKGIFNGKSAVIQMPTSAGKTKSSELIIRSAFIKGLTDLAVIVAPFRALCHEIHNDFYQQFAEDEGVEINLVSDVMQFDIKIENISERKYILILTPEKLDFLLRHQKDLAEAIGLIVYDEGHLFDDESRGVKYELLLSALKRNLPRNCQVILISAVMPNSYEIGRWLIGEDFAQIEAKEMSPTQRNVVFTNWKNRRAILQFLDPLNIDIQEFFVPKVIEKQKLQLRPREKKERFYPNRGESSEIAMTLGCKLVPSGPVAVFTARKDSATKCAREFINAFDRGLSITRPNEFMDNEVILTFSNYLGKVLGCDTVPTKAVSYGILMHHGSIPEGIRCCVEYALQNQKAKFVICTSTLSQGVNLPIRYLIVTTTRQGRDEIKVRDFHNLMGRAGRAGKYTEGTVIFSDNNIYDSKQNNYWYWDKAKKLLDPSMSENCKSKILDYFKGFPLEENHERIDQNKLNTTNTIKEYLLSALEGAEDISDASIFSKELAENTLAYFQANSTEKQEIVGYFQQLAKEIIQKIPSSEKRKTFSKVTLSLEDSLLLYDYLTKNIDQLRTCKNLDEFIEFLWPSIYLYTRNLPNIDEETLKATFLKWIKGDSYSEIFDVLSESGIKVKSNRKIIIDHVVDLCEGTYGYDSSMVVGSCIELIQLVDVKNEYEEKIEILKVIQKMVKYGLGSRIATLVYELGFNDRYIAKEIAGELNGRIQSKSKLKQVIRQQYESIKHIVGEYPDYYNYILSNIVG
ncbi:DEAD/DEAH box helicase (plasmid) [Cytobacillus firmus]|uniref:DEAD/DEAH box helicase n=1 Tax=Cytobacillus firmus TaxID=1399 RepID=UPI00207AF496|nr:DEAD/DEAH box helicase [Cytobacillus firmus]USK41824.1 DEAD/DEAH box helicase [Cytobacillus firmus]